MNAGYRIVISIFRGTAAGRALDLMASGLVVHHDTIEQAAAATERYLDAASAILARVGPKMAFGTICVVNLATCDFVSHEVLRSSGE